MVKILRKSSENHGAQAQHLLFLLAKTRYFYAIAFKMLKIELKFKFMILITKV